MTENSQQICFVTTSDYGLMMPIVAKVKKFDTFIILKTATLPQPTLKLNNRDIISVSNFFKARVHEVYIKVKKLSENQN